MSDNYKLILKNHLLNHARIITYPDGQQQVALDLDYFNSAKKKVVITSQIKRFDDLELLSAAVSALKWQDILIDQINFVYLMGARSDRLFHPGESNYFRDVIAPIINSYECDLSFFDLHGRASEFISAEHNRTWRWFHNEQKFTDGKILLAGDESALRITDDYFPYNDDRTWQENMEEQESMFFIKERHLSGMVTYLDLPAYNRIAADNRDTILIMDDLCDGGATFISEAKYLKEHFPNKKLDLYVSHGLFSNGVDHVAEHFDKIYTTNSYQDFEEYPKLEVFKVI